MPVVEGWKIPGVKVPPPNERVLKMLVSPETGDSEHMSILFSIISPSSTTGLHRHESGDECMYVATGRGTFICGSERTPIGPDVLLVAKKGVEHEIRNESEETMKLVAVFSPPLKPTGYIAEATRLRLKQ
ncbi:MAG: cupin domain-containing protein [Candidatus Bathyarchaeia archaeon]